jgi:peroxiredoxin
VEFNDVATQGPARPWNVTIEGIRIGGPPPAWYGLDRPSYAAPKIMGASAPDFKGQTADSRTIRLTDLRGKVVLLDFWATWCTACLEEMPVLEKLQSEEAISKIVVLGVSDEGGATVQNWLKRNGRSFRTLVDAKEIFAAFSIGPIPARVIVNEQGIVTRYFLGFDSEDRIRQALADALADRTKSPAVSP